MKIALISTGLGNVWRGYERFIYDWFHILKKEGVEVTLFKGGGETAGDEVIVPHVTRDGFLSRFAILREAAKGPYYFEALSFFIFLLPRLISNSFDLVHFTDCPLANFFYHARTKFRLQYPFKTLFTNGNPISDGACFRVDYLHQLTPWQEQLMKDIGVAGEKIFTIPFGIHFDQFNGEKDRSRLRAQYGIGQDKKVILSVAGINRAHKRIDYVIKEVARLGPDYFLFVAGHMEDSSLIKMAYQYLGNRFRFEHIPFERANEIYKLADIFTLCSLIEGFGISVIEAMASKVPVIVHDSEHYRWLVRSPHSLADLSCEGNLTERIEWLIRRPEIREEMVQLNFENAAGRFDWGNLKQHYLEMYAQILGQVLKGEKIFAER